MRKILILLAVLYNSPSLATTYYVSTIGSDANDGITTSTPYLTLAKAVDKYGKLSPGDTIKLLPGTYKSSKVSINKTGIEGSPITIEAYGGGEVILDFSLQPTDTWKQHSGNIYKITVPGGTVYNVVLNNDPKYRRRSSLANVTKPYDFYHDTASKVLYLWESDSGNPSGKPTLFIDSNEYNYGLYLNNSNYYIINGLTLMGSPGHAISIDGSHNTIKNSKFIYNGKNAVYFWSSLAGQRRDGAILDGNTSSWNMMRNWPRCSPGFTAGLWGQGLSVTNTDNAIVTNNIVSNGGGEGIGFVKVNNGLMANNKSFNNWSVGLYSDESQNITIRQNQVYVSEEHVTPGDIDDTITDSTTVDRCVQRLRQEGVTVGDEYYGDTTVAQSKDVKIYNNLIINTTYGFNYITEKVATPGLKNITFANNTVVLPNATGPRGDYSGVNIKDFPDSIGTQFINNIFYATYPTSSLVYGGYASAVPRGVVFLYNLWFHANNTAPFHWGGAYRTYPQWVGYNQGVNSINSDPIFALNSTNKYQLSAGSPAKDTGANMSTLYSQDYEGNQRDPHFDIGALEYGVATPTINTAPEINTIYIK